MSQTPPDKPDPLPKLWDTLNQIVGKLGNEFLLVTLGIVILLIVMGVLSPGVVPSLGGAFFYLIVVLAFLAYVIVRILDTWVKLRPPPLAPVTPGPTPPERPTPPRPLPPPDVLRDRYLHYLVDCCAHIPMSTIDLKAAAQLELAAVFTDLDVYDVGREERMERKPGEMLAGPEQAGRRLPALAALSRYPRLVLLGDPGSGKSMLVNFIALCMAGDWLNSPDANLGRLGESWELPRLLPVRVVLRDYAARGLPENRGLWEFIGAELKCLEPDGPLGQCLPALQTYLEQQDGALLLLDGLDEVPEAHRYRLRLKEAVARFARDFPHCRLLVTGRPYAYQPPAKAEDPDPRLPRFEDRRLAPFTSAQVEAFIQRWYAHVGIKDPALGPHNASRYAEQLARAVETNPRLADLAPNPLLLTLMASLHRWQEGGSLPERRQELYEQSVKLLLDLWQRPKQLFDAQGEPTGQEYDVFGELGIPQDNLRAALNLVAYEAHKEQPDPASGAHDVRARDLAGALYEASTNKGKAQGEQRIIQYLTDRAGLLIEREQGRVYTFPHRTFQEYLAASFLADENYPYLLLERLREDDARWREAALLAAAKAGRSAIWYLLETFCPQDWTDSLALTDPDWYAALRAAQALLEVEQPLRASAQRQRDLLKRLRGWLAALLERSALPAPERAAAGRALAHIGDPRPEALEPEATSFCRVPAGPFWMGAPEQDLPTLKEQFGEIEYYAYEWETPQHPLNLPDFYIARYPTTHAQFDAFVQAGGYREPRYWREAEAAGVWRENKLTVWQWRFEEGEWQSTQVESAEPQDFGPPFNLPNHPVVGVCWYEALAYTRWLTERLSQAAHERIGAGVSSETERALWEGLATGRWAAQLPSEAEWEKAARGAQREPGFLWGDEPDPDRANIHASGVGATSAVGCFPQGGSPYGAQDMSGNVWEWTRSLLGRWTGETVDMQFGYPYDPDDGRENLNADIDYLRVLRGGSFANAERRVLRCAVRYWIIPLIRGRNVGFRVVVSPISSLSAL